MDLYQWSTLRLELETNFSGIKEIKMVEENHGHEKVYGNEMTILKNSFDVNGRIIESFSKRQDMKRKELFSEELHKKTYDTNGNLTKETITDLKYDLDKELNYIYDKLENLIKIEHCHKNGDIYMESNLLYKFDSNGYKVEETLKDITHEEFDENPNFYYGSISQPEKIEYFYDSQNQLKEEVRNFHSTKSILNYDNGLFTKSITYTDNRYMSYRDNPRTGELIPTHISSRSYDNYSRPIETSQISPVRSGFDFYRKYTYLKNLIGVTIEMSSNNKVIETYYDIFEYDEKDNLIQIRRGRPDNRVPSKSEDYHYFSTQTFSYKNY